METAHITFKGEASTLTLEELDVTADMSDEDIIERVAQFYDRSVHELVDYVIQREENGNITIRPEAGWGV